MRVGDAESPEFPDHSFDAVLAGFVVFFLPDLAVALRSYARLLRPDGRLALSTFAEPSNQEIAFARTCGAAVAPYLPPPSTSDNPPPLQRLRTPESVTGAVQTADFLDVREERGDFEGTANVPAGPTSGRPRRPKDQARSNRSRVMTLSHVSDEVA